MDVINWSNLFQFFMMVFFDMFFKVMFDRFLGMFMFLGRKSLCFDRFFNCGYRLKLSSLVIVIVMLVQLWVLMVSRDNCRLFLFRLVLYFLMLFIVIVVCCLLRMIGWLQMILQLFCMWVYRLMVQVCWWGLMCVLKRCLDVLSVIMLVEVFLLLFYRVVIGC